MSGLVTSPGGSLAGMSRLPRYAPGVGGRSYTHKHTNDALELLILSSPTDITYRFLIKGARNYIHYLLLLIELLVLASVKKMK